MELFQLAKPAIFMLPPELAHTASILALKSGAIRPPLCSKDKRLNVSVGGIVFPNPLGLAAGYDKNAEVPDAILNLGFGFAEVGTVTPRAQGGNPKPRIFRVLRDKGLINRLGFNNEGHDAARSRLEARHSKHGVVGVNIGANKDSDDFIADYEKGIDAFYDLATYFTANISSPNTPGLRNLQTGEALEVLLARIFDRVHENQLRTNFAVPVFLKIAPDLSQSEIREIADVVKKSELSALIVSNTTVDRAMLSDRSFDNEAGGLSGRPVFEKSTHVLASMYRELGDAMPLIGAGGIMSVEDAITKIGAGASLIQLYSGMVFEGPGLPARIVNGLSRFLDQNHNKSISELVGIENDKW